jgi:quinoprotein glucose dehydrogenase
MFSLTAQAQPFTADGEWYAYGADLASTRYSPLDQINAANVDGLRIAWRWSAENFGPFQEG